VTNRELLLKIKKAGKDKAKQLDLWDNQLTSLPPEIAQLTSLEGLYLQDNELTFLPPEIGQLTSLTRLMLDGNPLIEPPPPVIAKGTKAILAYMRR